MRLFLISLFACVATLCLAQNQCNLSISGRVIDEHDTSSLAFAEVYIPELQRGTVVDSIGYFTLKNLCAGTYTLIATHIGCEPQKHKIKVRNSINELTLYLEHHQELLKEVKLKEQRVSVNAVRQSEIQADIANLEGKNLRVLKTGNTVLKPVIQGFRGNRVATIINNIAVQDQQWGTDHGMSGLLYPDDNVSLTQNALYGGLQVDGFNPWEQKTTVFGTGESNGWGGRLGAIHHTQFGESVALGVRAQSFRFGDLSAPNYILSNTASGGYNAQMKLVWNTKRNWVLETFAFYDAKDIGVLRASHVGNADDFQRAVEAEAPQFQEPFTYAIGFPRQEARQGMLSVEANHFYEGENGQQRLRLLYSYQQNIRREFDLARGNREDIPALNLRLRTHHLELAKHQAIGKNKLLFGLSQNFGINSNLENVRFEPVLPNYNAYESEAYMQYVWQELGEQARNSLAVELAFGLDASIAQFFELGSLQRENFLFYRNRASLAYNWSKVSDRRNSWFGNVKLLYAQRPPAINELLISGVHHGTATVEEGDISLRPEQKMGAEHVLGLQWQRISFETKLYGFYLRNFIYQQPLPSLRTTIRGTYPVFAFQQANSLMAGTELSLGWELNESLSYHAEGNYVFGQQLELNQPLPLIPPLLLLQSASYDWRFAYKQIKKVTLEIEHQYTGKQSRFDESIDLVPPPDDYHLINIGVQLKLIKGHTLGLRVQNVGNVSYRNYLDRFRYYASAPGINVLFNLKFNL